jgi:hypothetical protein
VLILACASALLYLLSQWPSIRGMPRDPLVKAFNGDWVTPNTRGMPPEHVRMVERAVGARLEPSSI